MALVPTNYQKETLMLKLRLKLKNVLKQLWYITVIHKLYEKKESFSQLLSNFIMKTLRETYKTYNSFRKCYNNFYVLI